MEKVGSYLVSVCAGAILCGILKSLVPEKNAAGRILRMVCGVFLIFTAVRPLTDIRLETLTLATAEILTDGEALSQDGKNLASDALADIIKDRTEAYILDKAQSLNADITVEVSVAGDPPSPASVTIHGSISPYAKSSLSADIAEQLGITKEDQAWTG